MSSPFMCNIDNSFSFVYYTKTELSSIKVHSRCDLDDSHDKIYSFSNFQSLISSFDPKFRSETNKCHKHFQLFNAIYCIPCKRNFCKQCIEESHADHFTINMLSYLNSNKFEDLSNNWNHFEKTYFNSLKDSCDKLISFYQDEIYQINKLYEKNVRINTELFAVLKENINFFNKYKDTFNINWYWNINNILEADLILGEYATYNDNFSGYHNTKYIKDYLREHTIINVDKTNNGGNNNYKLYKTYNVNNNNNNLHDDINHNNARWTPEKLIKLTDDTIAMVMSRPNNLINICSYPGYNVLFSLKLHTNQIWDVIRRKSWPHIISSSKDETIRILNYSTGICEQMLRIPNSITAMNIPHVEPNIIIRRHCNWLYEHFDNSFISSTNFWVWLHWKQSEITHFFEVIRWWKIPHYKIDFIIGLDTERMMIGASTDAIVYVINSDEMNCVTSIKSPNKSIISGLLLRNNRFVFGTEYGNWFIYDNDTFQLWFTWKDKEDGKIKEIKEWENGQLAVIIENMIKIFDLEKRICCQTITVDRTKILGLEEMKMNMIISLDTDKRIKEWFK